MNANEFRTAYISAVVDLANEFRSLSVKEKRAPLGKVNARVRRIRTEHGLYVMQRKVLLSRIGLSVEDARALAGDGVAFLHMDRHRNPEAIVLKATDNELAILLVAARKVA